MKISIIWEKDELKKSVEFDNRVADIIGSPHCTVEEEIESTRLDRKYVRVRADKRGIYINISTEAYYAIFECVVNIMILLYPIMSKLCDMLAVLATAVESIFKLLLGDELCAEIKSNWNRMWHIFYEEDGSAEE